MKKFLAGSLLLLVITGASAPFVNGLLMEKIFTRSLNDLNQMYTDTGSDLTIDIISYDRHLLSSDIEWRIRFGSLATVYGVDEIILVDKAVHGFTGVASQTSLAKNEWFKDFVTKRLSGKNPLNITTTYRLWGTIESLIEILPCTFEMGGEQVDLMPGKVSTLISRGLTHLVSAGLWEGLAVSDKLRIEGVSVQSDLEKISTYIWSGPISSTIGKLRIEDQEHDFGLVRFKSLYSVDYDREKDSLSISGTVGAENLGAGERVAKDTFARLDVHNIDARSYEEFMQVYSKSMYAMLESVQAAKEHPEMMDEATQERLRANSLQMMAAYEKFLKKDLEVKISDVHALLPEGNVTGNFELRLNQDITFAQLFLIAMQPDLAFALVSLQSDCSFPAELAGDNAFLVTPLGQGMQTGLFVPEGKNLVHRAQTRNGKLYLNGNEVSFNQKAGENS